MEYYFDPDDKLERKRYAEFLKSMLENCDHYRREDSDGAYVIAIDSPWGTGKTRFAKMLRNYLEGREPIIKNGKVDQTYISVPSDARKFNVIYYNSWETDYWNDALEPLIYSIYESRILEIEGAEADNEKMKKAIFQILKGMGIAILKLFIGDPAAGVLQGALDGLAQVPSDPLAAFKERMTQYSEFQSALESVIKRTNKKLVIIVDELDRCRPTFAIQTLELAKHLFSVKGLIFIFALDIKQLSNSVKTIYGQEMDAPGYLCRFFDYISKTPLPDQKSFIKLYLEQHRAFSSRSEYWFKKIPEFLDELAEPFTLSLRDIETIIKTYHLLFDTYLYDCSHPQIHLLYIFLITLKYKHGALYSRFLLNKKKTNNDEDPLTLVKKYLPTFNYTSKGILVNQLQKLNSGLKLQYCELEVLPGSMDLEKREPITKPMKIDSLKEISIGSKRELEIAHKVKGEGVVSMIPTKYNFKTGQILGDILEYNDLAKWETINELTLGEYYYQQLEMFNFALPADNTESQT